jgi:2,3-diketo-5-methylthio-1-phosphopentane phosphatase
MKRELGSAVPHTTYHLPYFGNQMQRESNGTVSPVVFTDFDGTITQLDVTDEILSQLAHPSWQEVEQEWTRGLIGSRECLERQIALVDASAEELDALIDAVPIDPAFAAFSRFTRKRGIPLYVLSEGFDYVIVRILKRAGVNGPVRNGTHMFSSALRLEGRRLIPSFPHSAQPCEHGCATCKAALLRRFGKGKFPVIFVGDGLSDRFAVDEADVVFAKRQLLAYCQEHGKACHPFDTFAEVEQAIALLMGREEAAKRFRCQASGVRYQVPETKPGT